MQIFVYSITSKLNDASFEAYINQNDTVEIT